MVRARDIVANRFRRVAAKEHGARVADLRRHRVRIGDGKFQMLRRQPVDKRDGVFEILDHDDRTVIVPARPRDVGAGQVGQMFGDRSFDGGCEIRVVRDQDRLGDFVMLGLGQQIDGDP